MQVFKRILRIFIKFPRIGSLTRWQDKQYATCIHCHNQVIVACGNHTRHYIQINVVRAAKWAQGGNREVKTEDEMGEIKKR